MSGPITLRGLEACALEPAAWVEPLEVLAPLADQDGAVGLLSDGGPEGRWSYVAAQPDQVVTRPAGSAPAYDDLAGLGLVSGPQSPGEGPPLRAGVVGLVAYDLGARRMIGRAAPDDLAWPDLILARYPAMLAFDHQARRVWRIGRGRDAAAARDSLDRSGPWLAAARPVAAFDAPARTLTDETGRAAYRCAVAEVVRRIATGELFQANIARAWTGKLASEAEPFAVLARAARAGAAPYGAYLRAQDLALVSNSPERFLSLAPGSARLETLPIKGTRPRGADASADAAAAADLLASAKDRAENLMIVDLMRNDLARVCAPGSVRADALFELRSYERVHHMVSRVSGRPVPNLNLADLFEATFPPGSVTGAPKHQAMRVIADHEPPRGPWCGSLFLLGAEGGLQASVLIRTAAFRRDGQGWRFRLQAGAGIVADSDPEAEADEVEAKAAAVIDALSSSRPASSGADADNRSSGR